MFRSRKHFLVFLLSAVLVFAQHSAMAHLLWHVSEEAGDHGDHEEAGDHEKETLFQYELCVKCIAAEKLTHLSANQESDIGLSDARYVHRAVVPRLVVTAECVRFPCRDPPKTL